MVLLRIYQRRRCGDTDTISLTVSRCPRSRATRNLWSSFAVCETTESAADSDHGLPYVQVTGLPVIIDFYSDGCGPCRQVGRIFLAVGAWTTVIGRLAPRPYRSRKTISMVNGHSAQRQSHDFNAAGSLSGQNKEFMALKYEHTIRMVYA